MARFIEVTGEHGAMLSLNIDLVESLSAAPDNLVEPDIMLLDQAGGEPLTRGAGADHQELLAEGARAPEGQDGGRCLKAVPYYVLYTVEE